jgi:hypothetical protein
MVDEFDDGMLAPSWNVLIGTANEAGGAAICHDPGFSVQLGPTQFEISTIENEVHEIEDGAGDFTATSYWAATLPAVDREFHLQLYAISPIIEAAGLSVNNLSPQIAAQQNVPAGSSISQTLTNGFGPGFSTLQSDSVAISPGSVTGQIVLRMTLDDATNMLTCSFSLDGGTTFASPFPPVPVFNSGVTDYEILVGAAALGGGGGPGPSPQFTLPLQLLSVRSGTSPTSRRITYRAKAPLGNGITLNGDPTFAGATFNLQLDATSQCFFMPASGWTRNGPGWTYKDRSGANGPVKLARIRQTNNGATENKVILTGANGQIDIVPPNPGNEANANFRISNGGHYCTSTAGGTIRPNDARTFKAKKAPAPAACYATACSPNGAFLDDGGS